MRLVKNDVSAFYGYCLVTVVPTIFNHFQVMMYVWNDTLQYYRSCEVGAKTPSFAQALHWAADWAMDHTDTMICLGSHVIDLNDNCHMPDAGEIMRYLKRTLSKEEWYQIENLYLCGTPNGQQNGLSKPYENLKK